MSAVIRAPRGTSLRCRGWKQEAALRMLMNNLDPEVAERPDDLVVYGGTGKAARDWPSFHAIVRELETLADDETLLVQSGRPVGVFRTHEEAPRVLIANANLVGHWSNWEQFRALEKLGLTMYGQMTAGSWIYIGIARHSARHLRDVRRRGSQAFRRIARRATGGHWRTRRHGWRPAPGRDHERRRLSGYRCGSGAHSQAHRDRILRRDDARAG